MRNRILLFFLMIGFAISLDAQQPGQRTLRIVDTLTTQEKSSRNPIVLRSELDSMIKAYNAAHPVQQEIKQVPVLEKNSMPSYMLIGLFVLIALSGLAIVMIYQYQQKINKAMEAVNKDQPSSKATKEKIAKGKLSPQV